MTFEERKQECIVRNIVPGVIAFCAWNGDEFVVGPYDRWRYGYKGLIDVGGNYLWDQDTDRYAKVITPAEPSEVDRLRERVKELEGALEPFANGYDQVKQGHTLGWESNIGTHAVLHAYCGFELRIDHLRNARAILNKSTNTPDQQ